MALATAPTCLIAGAGDLGVRLATLRQGGGDEVVAVRRRRGPDDDDIRWLQADLASGEGLARLPKRPEAVVFCAAPDQRDETSYRRLYRDGLARLMDALESPRWLFVSSTAVFGEDDAEHVDEDTPAQPRAFNGRVLLEAEQLLAGQAGATVLRLSGLYGPGRDALRRRALSGEPGRRHWTNRIHIDDAAAAVSHLLDLPAPAPIYLGNDDLPALESEVFAWLRQQAGLPILANATAKESGRRINNSRLRASGWEPTFPDYRAGYAALPTEAGV